MEEQILETTVYRSVGADPKHVENLFAKAQTIDDGQLRYEHYARYSEDVIRLVYDRNIDQRILLGVMQTFSDGLEESLYATEETPLQKRVIELLQEKGKRLSVAESFTGGGIAALLTSVSGASNVFFEGVTTYHEQAKMKRLGVREETLRKFGAVSKETAAEMASGLLATGDCDIALATTGIAGPNSDRTGFPVGLCFIAIGDKEGICVYQYGFDGDRMNVTQTAIKRALFLAYNTLKNM